MKSQPAETRLRIGCLLALALLPVLSMPALSQQADSANPATQDTHEVYPDETWARWEDPARVGYPREILKGLRARLEDLDTTAMMIVIGGKVAFEYGDLEQVSYIASVRKSVLAMLYGKYVEEGFIELDATLEDLGMDDIQGLLPHERKARVEDLITARSGIYHPASNPGDNTDEAPERGSQQPGEYFLYNNWDFNAAGKAFEIMTETNIYDALEQDFAIPLGMRDFDRARHRKNGDTNRSEHLAYHMYFSTRDMARLGYLMLREGKWKGREIIPSSWVRKIVSIHTPLEEMNPQSLREDRFAYGVMWWIWDGKETDDRLRGGYTGMGAFGQFITVVPKLDMVIAHKTAVPPYERNVGSRTYATVVERIVEAHQGQ